MNNRLLDDTIAYVRKELTNIHQDLTWADGAKAETLQTRQTRLLAEFDRLESMRHTSAIFSKFVSCPVE